MPSLDTGRHPSGPNLNKKRPIRSNNLNTIRTGTGGPAGRGRKVFCPHCGAAMVWHVNSLVFLCPFCLDTLDTEAAAEHQVKTLISTADGSYDQRSGGKRGASPRIRPVAAVLRDDKKRFKANRDSLYENLDDRLDADLKHMVDTQNVTLKDVRNQ